MLSLSASPLVFPDGCTGDSTIERTICCAARLAAFSSVAFSCRNPLVNGFENLYRGVRYLEDPGRPSVGSVFPRHSWELGLKGEPLYDPIQTSAECWPSPGQDASA